MKKLIDFYHRLRCRLGLHARGSRYMYMTSEGMVRVCKCPWCGCRVDLF